MKMDMVMPMMKVDFCSINRSLLCPFSGAFRVTSLSHENQWGSKASYKMIELNSIGLKARRAKGFSRHKGLGFLSKEKDRQARNQCWCTFIWCIFMEYKTWLGLSKHGTWWLSAHPCKWKMGRYVSPWPFVFSREKMFISQIIPGKIIMFNHVSVKAADGLENWVPPKKYHGYHLVI